MNLPNLSQPVIRTSVGMPKTTYSIEPSWHPLCGTCKGAIEGIGKVVIGMGCTEAAGAFELACNAALDWIPGVGEGPSEIACTAGSIALGIACKAAGGTVTKGVMDQVANTVCNKVGLC